MITSKFEGSRQQINLLERHGNLATRRVHVLLLSMHTSITKQNFENQSTWHAWLLNLATRCILIMAESILSRLLSLRAREFTGLI
jgi:hypothetical protein